MSIFSDRFKYLRRSRKISQQELADGLHTSKSSVNMYERGERTPKFEMLDTIADYFNVSPAWLAGYTNDPTNYNDPDLIAEIPQAILEHFDGDVRKAYTAWRAADADYINEGLHSKEESSKNDTKQNKTREPSNLSAVIPRDNIYQIPVFETVSAGFGEFASNEIVEYIPMFINNPYDAEDTIGIRVKGDSMYPKIENGDIIIVRKQDSVDSGSVAVLLLDGEEGLVKKVEYGPDWIELHSFNPEYMTRRFEGADVLRLRVVGLVIGSYKKF